MKKLLLGLGTIGTVVAPIAAVVSCTSWDQLQAEPKSVAEYKITSSFTRTSGSMGEVRRIDALTDGTKLTYKTKTITLTAENVKALKASATKGDKNHNGESPDTWFSTLGKILGLEGGDLTAFAG